MKASDIKTLCVTTMVSNTVAWVSTAAVVAFATAKSGKLTGAPLLILPMLVHATAKFSETTRENDCEE